MKKIVAVALLLASGIGLSGCMRAPVMPPMGWAFSDLKAPLDIDYQQTPVTGKTGVAESMSILGLIAQGDASATAAAANGGIKTIEHADYEYYNVLGVLQRYRTVVYGK